MSNRARTTRYASDDHADDLLADILDSTEDQAREEAQRLQQSMAEKRRAEEQAAAEAHATRLAERQQKLERELERQAKLAERRTQRMEALKIPEPSDEEEEVAPQEITPVLDEAAIRRQIAEEVREELRVIGMTPMPEPQPAAPAPVPRRGLYAAAAGILIAGGIAAAGIIASATTYTPDPNPYAKAVFAPMDRQAVALEMGSVLIPQVEEVVVVDEPQAAPDRKVRKPAAARPTPKEHRDKGVFNKKVEKNDASKSFDKFKGLLDNAEDPFTIDEKK